MSVLTPSSSPALPTNATTPPSPINPISPTNAPPHPPPPPPPPSSANPLLIALGVGIGIGGLFVLLAVGIFVLFYKRRKKRRRALSAFSPNTRPDGQFDGTKENAHHSTLPPLSSVAINMDSDKLSTQIIFTYEELAKATDTFSSLNLLGEGGFGYVHKGVLSNGNEIAVKQLKTGSGQGEREFQAEVAIISSVHHRHLVSLVGYCISGEKRLLVYEFVPNKTLEFHLHGKGRPPLRWETRMKIALGSARGVAYLHEDCHPKIIHRDIKASNILLEDTFEAKVADFGLARLTLDTDTHVSTRVMGTFGYLAPEYALTGKLTEKSDNFSFGVMLLELITGRRPIDKVQFLDDNIVDWARPLLGEALENGNFDSLADPRLMRDYDSTEMTRMVACAAASVRHLARRRPRMSQIVRALEGKIPVHDLNEFVRPGDSSDIYNGSVDYESAEYKKELEKFRKLALETQQYDASQCSILTASENNLHRSGSSSGQPTTQGTGSFSLEESQLNRDKNIREIKSQFAEKDEQLQ
ncbi:proline-rich receptor-like protein kinase PERK15 [Impatiens glandulifera]|uniref:proline-rich receptor-like protein kinase PERK15 n=1 Tax=Impatiens glandulifera TaxID=253017 RepID=UPI001FB184AC|nr:proline-rich receptor-like protein kinase PERK15 [Impatiens glandulifera]